MFAKSLLTLFACLFSISGYAKELDQRQSFTNCQPTSALSVFADISNASKKKITVKNTKKNASSVAKSFRLETSAVAEIKLNGLKYHVADYPDGTRVITCLDGSLKGLQEVYFEGSRILMSIDVEWHSKYFEHKYPNGKVKSYPNKQIADIY